MRMVARDSSGHRHGEHGGLGGHGQPPDMDYFDWGAHANVALHDGEAGEDDQDEDEGEYEDEDDDEPDPEEEDDGDFDRDDRSDDGEEEEEDSNDEEDDGSGEHEIEGGVIGAQKPAAPVPEYKDGRNIDMSDAEAMGVDGISKTRMRNIRILFQECWTDYDNMLNGVVEEENPEGQEHAEREADADADAGREEDEGEDDDSDDDEEEEDDEVFANAELVNGPLPRPPELDWLNLNPLRQAPPQGEGALIPKGEEDPGAADPEDVLDPTEFDATLNPSLSTDDQIKSLMTQTRAAKVNNYLLKEVISYQLRLVDFQAAQLEQRDERSRALELELKEIKNKLNGAQDEILAMKSNQNLIGRHEQATQTTSLVYPITITPTPRPAPPPPPPPRLSPVKIRPGGNSTSTGNSNNNNNSSNNGNGNGGPSTSGMSQSQLRPHSLGGWRGRGRGRGRGSFGGAGSGGFKRFPKLPEPNNITHRTPPKYQYGHGQTRMAFGSSDSPVKKAKSPSPSLSPPRSSPPKQVSDHENDGGSDHSDDGDDEDDEDDEPEFFAHAHSSAAAARPHSANASNQHVNTYSKKASSRQTPKLISAHRRSSSSTDSSPPTSGRTTPTRTKTKTHFGRHSHSRSPNSSPPPRHSSPIRDRVSSPAPARNESDHNPNSSPTHRMKSKSRSPVRDRENIRETSPHKLRSPSPRQASPPARQPSPPSRQPSPPRGRLSSLRRTGKDKLYFTPTRSPSKSKSSAKFHKNQKSPEATQGPSASSSTSQNSISAEKQNSTSSHDFNSKSRSTRSKSKSKSRSPPPSRPRSIAIRETSNSPDLYARGNNSASASASSSPSNSLSSQPEDDPYELIFSELRKQRPTPIIVTSVAEARLKPEDLKPAAGGSGLRKAVMIKANPLAMTGLAELKAQKLKKDEFLKHAQTACVRLDRSAVKATTTTSSSAAPLKKSRPPPPMRTIDYDWMIPSRPIPFINDGQPQKGGAGSSKTLVKTALRRKRNSPQTKEEIAKKIRAMRFTKTGLKGTKEKEIREYIAQKYEVKKEAAKKASATAPFLPEEEEEEEELYDIDEYIEPAESRIKYFMRAPPPPIQKVAEPPPAVAAIIASASVPSTVSAAPKSSSASTPSTTSTSANAKSSPASINIKSTSTTKAAKPTKFIKKKLKTAPPPPKRRLSTRSDKSDKSDKDKDKNENSRASPILSRALTRQTRGSTEKVDEPRPRVQSPPSSSTSLSQALVVRKPGPIPGRRKIGQLSWPPRTFTNRHDQTLMTDDPFYAMGCTGRSVGSNSNEVNADVENVEDENGDDDCRIIAEFEDLGPPGVDPDSDDSEKEETGEVLVPSWRVVKYAPIKSRAQLDEDLDDATYEKRHGKWEIDERRRKRWDAQIQREEEYTKYLREREAQKAQRALKRYNRAAGGVGTMELDDTSTLLPDGKQARYILVADNLPVTSFGYAVPDIVRTAEDFTRPWKDRNEEEGPEEEVDIILPVITRAMSKAAAAAEAARRGLTAQAYAPVRRPGRPPGRKPSTSTVGASSGKSPGPASEGLLAIEGPSGSGGTNTNESKETTTATRSRTHQIKTDPHKDSDMEVD